MGDVVNIKQDNVTSALEELEDIYHKAKSCIQDGTLIYFMAVLEEEEDITTLSLVGNEEDKIRAASSMCAFASMTIESIGDKHEQDGVTTH